MRTLGVTGHKSVQAAPLTYCLRLPQCHSRKVDIHPSHCLSPSVLAAEQKIKHLKRGSRNYTTDPARDKLWRVLDVPPNVHLCCESRKPTQGMSINTHAPSCRSLGSEKIARSHMITPDQSSFFAL